MSEGVLSSFGKTALPAIVAGAFAYPDNSVREEVRSRLKNWIESGNPTHEAGQVCDFLRAFEGTTLEPFVLGERELELAVWCTRIAFSGRGKQTRFRVVSEETLGSRGGLILTNNIEGYLVERWPHGNRRRTSKRTWHIAPGCLEDFLGLGAMNTCCQGSIDVGTQRIKLRIEGNSKWSRIVQVLPANIDELLREVRVGGSGRTLHDLGIVMSLDECGILISANTPEAILRLTAVIDADELLEVSFREEEHAIGSLTLALCEDEKGRLEVIFSITYTSQTPELRNLMSIPLKGPKLPVDLRRKLADWCLGPGEWKYNFREVKSA